MQVEHLYFDGEITTSNEFGPNQKAALRTAFLASDAIPQKAASIGLSNPMAQAVFERLKQDGVTLENLSNGWLLKDDLGFDVKRKLASYVYN
jgi:hypothetical protein